MRSTGGPRSVRCGEPYESVVREKSVWNYPLTMLLSHVFSWFSACSCDFGHMIAWTFMWFCGFCIVPLLVEHGPLRMLFGLEHILRGSMSVYGTKIVGSLCLKVLYAHLSATTIQHWYGSKHHQKNVQAPSLVLLIIITLFQENNMLAQMSV